MELQRGISFAYNQSRIGTVTDVLVDGFRDGLLVARSEFESPEVDGEILVRTAAKDPARWVGRFLRVRITGADDYDLMAEPLNDAL